MFKLCLLILSIGGFIFAGSWNDIDSSDSNSEYKQYSIIEDTSDDHKAEAGRRRGKGMKSRRRGGGGLR